MSACAVFLAAILLVFGGVSAVPAQNRNTANVGQTIGKPVAGVIGKRQTTAEIMANPAARQPRKHIYLKQEFEVEAHQNRPQDAKASPTSQLPSVAAGKKTAGAAPRAPQVVSTTFDGVTGPTETSSFPPDSMGAVGPSQFFIFVNGRLRTFTKATGTADGVVNVDPDVFFSSVMTPETSPGINFTSDPQIRYDRLSGRWFLTIIDVPSSSSNSIGDTPNRILIAVSDGSVISAGTVWTFYYVQQDMVGRSTSSGEFLDYPSLGVDNNALYIGGDMFGASSGSFTGCSAFVIRKSSVLAGGPVVTTAFRQIVPSASGEGPFAPRGVDNYDPSANEGYIIGTSNAAYGRLDLRRVSDPGGTPAISANILITVNTTAVPIPVAHLGNTGGNNGRLDSLDDRLYAAHIRNGRLWTAHNIGVTASGVAGGTTGGSGTKRDAVRWYELSVPVGSGTPTVVESGTVYDTATNVSTARQYWIPSVMVSGQGHAALGFSTAGTTFHVDAVTNGRLVGDALGTLGAPTFLTSSTTAYNPSGDSGSSSGRRWGDYSFTSLDPNDDMTMWSIQEFCDGANTYGLEVAKLLAPPPATPASANPSTVASGQSSINVTITGNAVSGSGFYDPGTGFPNHISAAVSGGVVLNSVTYTDPTHVTLNLDTTNASSGSQNVTITNPDGQSITGTGILTVSSPLQLTSAVSRLTHGSAGTFDVNLPLTGEPGVECRNAGGNFSFVFTFSNNITAGNANVTGGSASLAGNPTFSGNTMTVNLTGVTDVQTVTVTLSGVTDTFSQALADTSVSANMLIGDTTGNKTVNSTDVAQAKSQTGIPVSSSNFRDDVTINGVINSTDVALIKSAVGNGL